MKLRIVNLAGIIVQRRCRGVDPLSAKEPACPIDSTGYPDSEMLDRILEKGPITVLKKPLQVDQLHQTVRILGHKEIAKAA
jgi:hypothetical protein